MSGGGIAGLKATNHRRYTNAATLMREMPTAKLEAEDNQHNTEICEKQSNNQLLVS